MKNEEAMRGSVRQSDPLDDFLTDALQMAFADVEPSGRVYERLMEQVYRSRRWHMPAPLVALAVAALLLLLLKPLPSSSTPRSLQTPPATSERAIQIQQEMTPPSARLPLAWLIETPHGVVDKMQEEARGETP